MILNRIEFAMMNNPVRSAIQRRFEAGRLLRMGGTMNGGTALEVGCGRGVGTEIILDVFGAGRVDAFDLDPRMIARAQRRLATRRDRVRLWTGSVTHIPAREASYDAVFDFGIIHHVPNWRDGLREIRRVLRPGGRFYAEEILRRFIVHPFWKRVLDHPQRDRFDHDRFRDALAETGLRPVTTEQRFEWFGWFVADRPAT